MYVKGRSQLHIKNKRSIGRPNVQGQLPKKEKGEIRRVTGGKRAFSERRRKV
jgi:hypothetical protein